MAYDIFISYRRKDSAGLTSGTNIARTIKQQLEIEGYMGRVFFDYSELNDDEFEKIILTAIEQCKVFVLVLSRDSMMRCANEKDWVRREICHAHKCGLKIVPIEPDNLFNGYPETFPSELDIIKRIQHSAIHMDSSFERDMRAMIETRIAPVLSQHSGTPSMKGALVRVDSDLECKVLRYGEQIATVGEGLSEIRLPKGKHKISFVGVESDVERYDCIIDIRDLDYEEYVEVRLLDRYNARKGEEKRLSKEKKEQRSLARAQKKAEQEEQTEDVQLEDAAKLVAAATFAPILPIMAVGKLVKDAIMAKTYKVGDYYNENGKEGVVFWVDETGKHGKIVGLGQVCLEWCGYSHCKKVGADSETDGKANTDKIMALLDSEGYSAVKWCRDKGEDWYLPATDELKLLLHNDSVHDAVNRALESQGAKKLYNFSDGGYELYWSSTEDGAFYAYPVGCGSGYTSSVDKYDDWYVRAVAQF